MPPEPGAIQIDPILTNLSIAYRNLVFIAGRVFPIIPVGTEEGRFFVFGKERFEVPESKRAPRTESREIPWTVTEDSYACEEYALHDLIDDRDLKYYASAMDAKVESVEMLTDMILLGWEKRIADIAFSKTYITNNITLTGGTGLKYWSDTTNGDPLGDIDTGKDAVAALIGRDPNTMILGNEAWLQLKNHPDVIDRVKHVGLGVASAAKIAELIGMENIIIGKTLYNSTPKKATPTLTRLWGDNCLIAYIEPKPGRKKPSLGYTFKCKLKASGQMYEVRIAREEKKHSDWVEAGTFQDEKLTSADCGYLIYNCKE